MSKPFLAVGDYLINPYFIAYAIVEGSQLRLGFAWGAADAPVELQLQRDEAAEVLRWLRLNAEFLSRNGSFGSVGGPSRALGGGPLPFSHRRSHATIGRGTGVQAVREAEETVNFA